MSVSASRWPGGLHQLRGGAAVAAAVGAAAAVGRDAVAGPADEAEVCDVCGRRDEVAVLAAAATAAGPSVPPPPPPRTWPERQQQEWACQHWQARRACYAQVNASAAGTADITAQAALHAHSGVR
jgi:hypothetical protein